MPLYFAFFKEKLTNLKNNINSIGEIKKIIDSAMKNNVHFIKDEKYQLNDNYRRNVCTNGESTYTLNDQCLKNKLKPHAGRKFIVFHPILLLGSLASMAQPDAPPEKHWVPVSELTDEFEGSELDDSKWLNYHPYWAGREPSGHSSDSTSMDRAEIILAFAFPGMTAFRRPR